jgi:HEAT repeats
MAVNMDQVRAALEPEEPDYPRAAKLGPAALPHLEKIITSDHLGLAAKAAYLAGLIGTEKSLPALQKAARSSATTVRIAAAAAARHLSNEQSDSLLLQLVDDADVGVRKVAMKSAPAVMSDALRSRVAAAQPETPKARGSKKKSKAKKAPRKSARGKKR